MPDAKPPTRPLPPPGTGARKAPVKTRRQRFTDLHVKRTRNARRALRNVARMGNTAGYEYTPEEAAIIVRLLKEDVAEVERAFKGVPKEKGLYDL